SDARTTACRRGRRLPRLHLPRPAPPHREAARRRRLYGARDRRRPGPQVVGDGAALYAGGQPEDAGQRRHREAGTFQDADVAKRQERRDRWQMNQLLAAGSDYLSCLMLRVAAGSETTRPSSSSVTIIWQPRREVWVRPKARSSMSSSSSLAVGRISYHSGSTMTWQVEQASEPSQAPSRSMLLRCAISSTDSPLGASISTRVPSVLMNVTLGMLSFPSA